jgi:hypothetical protein
LRAAAASDALQRRSVGVMGVQAAVGKGLALELQEEKMKEKTEKQKKGGYHD